MYCIATLVSYSGGLVNNYFIPYFLIILHLSISYVGGMHMVLGDIMPNNGIMVILQIVML